MLKQLDNENRKLKQLVAYLSLGKHILHDVLSKKNEACSAVRGRGMSLSAFAALATDSVALCRSGDGAFRAGGVLLLVAAGLAPRLRDVVPGVSLLEWPELE